MILDGTYGDRGTKDCDKRPGQLGHEVDDANFFAKASTLEEILCGTEEHKLSLFWV